MENQITDRFLQDTLRIAYQTLEEDAPINHRARTPNCLPVSKFDNQLESWLTATEREHIEHCQYCLTLLRARSYTASTAIRDSRFVCGTISKLFRLLSLERISDFFYYSRHRVVNCGAGLLACILAYYVIFGSNGFLVYEHKRMEYLQLQEQNRALQQQSKNLEQQIQALKRAPQAIEKEAREHLNYIRSGEVVYTQQNSSGAGSPNIQGAQGHVTITVNNRTPNNATEAPKPKIKGNKPDARYGSEGHAAHGSQ